MPVHAPLAELVLTYAIALFFILVLGRLRVPPIVAFIVAGAVAGPAGVGIVRTQDDVETLAEMGIVLLLFTVGLEFSLTEIRRIWQKVLIGGSLQIAFTAAAICLLVLAFFGSMNCGSLDRATRGARTDATAMVKALATPGSASPYVAAALEKTE